MRAGTDMSAVLRYHGCERELLELLLECNRDNKADIPLGLLDFLVKVGSTLDRLSPSPKFILVRITTAPISIT
jgi:hypothetical protein